MRLRKPRTRYVTADESRAIRKAAGLSQRTAAVLFGIGCGQVANWERGHRETPKWAVIIYRILAAKRQALITGQAPVVELS